MTWWMSTVNHQLLGEVIFGPTLARKPVFSIMMLPSYMILVRHHQCLSGSIYFFALADEQITERDLIHDTRRWP